MQQMATRKAAFHRDTTGGPPVREADSIRRGGHQYPSADSHLKAIVHNRLPQLPVLAV